MTLTSLTPTSFSVPPYFGDPVPGFSAWLPPVGADAPDVDDAVGPVEPPLDAELLHAAASTVTATAVVVAPMARRRMCLTTLVLLKFDARRGSLAQGILEAKRLTVLALATGHGTTVVGTVTRRKVKPLSA
jgi:hypothetical protein